jgi:hypothetical protein
MTETMTLEEFRRKFPNRDIRPVRGRSARGRSARGGKGKAVDWEQVLLDQIKQAGLPEPKREYRFHARRRWRFDFCWKNHGRLVACEVDGGVYSGGRHTRGKGFEGDCEKLNEAALYGYLVIRVTPSMIKDGRALDWLERALL